MSRITISPPRIAIGLVALMLAACSTATGGTPIASPSASPSTSPLSPEPTPPAAPASPSTPTDAPTPTSDPVVVVRFDTGNIARVTADGVAVRILPGLDQPMIAGYGFEGSAVDEVRLDTGDRVAVIWGPVLADGHTWYAVRHVETAQPITFAEGWIAADVLADDGPMEEPFTLLTADGLGSGKAVSGDVSAYALLYVNVVAAPMPGDASCEAEVVLTGTDGEAVTIGSSEVAEATQFFASPLENAALVQETAGTVTLQVRSDCSWAGMAFIPAG